jgi:hypothetical protein
MTDDAHLQFSARIRAMDALGIQPSGPPIQVRDVLICTPSDTADVTSEERMAYLPIGFPRWPGPPGSARPVELGRGLRIDRLSDADSELVMNACTPRGHYFAPIRQFGHLYSFVRPIDIEAWRAHPFHWDRDGVISDAVMLSRLVRDNAYSTRFAARIADFEGGEQTVVYTLGAESKAAYRLRRDRDWLDEDDGGKLRDLLGAFWALEDALPPRVRRAMWRAEYASWLRWGDLPNSVIVSGFEALVKTEQSGAGRQFAKRVPALANELGCDGISKRFCRRIYGARSEWVHGAHVRLFSTGLERDEARELGVEEGPTDAAERAALNDICRLQDLLRRALRRCIEDAEFRAVFEDDDRIRARWSPPSNSREQPSQADTESDTASGGASPDKEKPCH